jgi:hypothetical protein
MTTKTHLKYGAPLAALLFAVLSVTSAKAQIVLNGSFETNDDSDGAAYLANTTEGLTFFTDWTVGGWRGAAGAGVGVATNSSQQIVRSSTPAGNQYVWIQDGTTNAAASENYIYQQITLATSGTYSLTFLVGARQSDTLTDTYAIDLNGTSAIGGMTLASGTTTYASALASESGSFSATAGTYYLELVNTSPADDTGNTIGFDGVVITLTAAAVPEPSSVMLIGIGAMALVLTWRRRNKLV